MNTRARVRIAYTDAAEANAVAAALQPENESYLSTTVEGAAIHAEADARDAGALLHTLDDFLACLSAAEKAARVGRSSAPDPD